VIPKVNRIFTKDQQLPDRDQVMIEIGYTQARMTNPDFFKGLDCRLFNCPKCGAVGANTTAGYIRYVCGAEVTGEEMTTRCEKKKAVA